MKWYHTVQPCKLNYILSPDSFTYIKVVSSGLMKEMGMPAYSMDLGKPNEKFLSLETVPSSGFEPWL